MKYILKPLFVISIIYTLVALPFFVKRTGGACGAGLFAIPFLALLLIPCLISLFHSIKKATKADQTETENIHSKILAGISAIIWGLLYLSSGLKLALIYSAPLLITIVLTFVKAFIVKTEK